MMFKKFLFSSTLLSKIFVLCYSKCNALMRRSFQFRRKDFKERRKELKGAYFFLNLFAPPILGTNSTNIKKINN